MCVKPQRRIRLDINCSAGFLKQTVPNAAMPTEALFAESVVLEPQQSLPPIFTRNR